jgi:threonyl-tRNA synthetase
MRFLSFHCDYFKYLATKESRSPIKEDLSPENKEGGLNNVIVLFISVEKEDESKSNLISNSIKEIQKIIRELKVDNIVILSFAHLFGNLSSPQFAFKTLKRLESELKKFGYSLLRPPFGWFNKLEIKAKGHPLSRISRQI